MNAILILLKVFFSNISKKDIIGRKLYSLGILDLVFDETHKLSEIIRKLHDHVMYIISAIDNLCGPKTGPRDNLLTKDAT